MDLYEHQGKELFARYGIPTGEGRVAHTPEEARAGAEELGGGRVVVKAQVLAGGRGKAGGVKVADDPADAEEKTRGILGLDIKGHITRRVWVEKAISIDKEYYFSITFDRGAKANLFMLSTMGGMDIEAVAVDHPDKLARIHLNPAIGLQPYFVRRLLYAAGVPKAEHKGVGDLIAKATRCTRHRRHAGRGQPARDHRRRAPSWPPTRRSRSTTTRCSGTPTSRRCATSRPPTRRSRWPASAASRTSSSTAPSASSATAPGS